MSRTTQSSGETGLRDVLTSVRSMTASPLLYVGALTVVGAHELVGLLAQWLHVSQFLEALLLVPVTLVLLYGQLAVLAYYEQRGYRRGCTDER